jgi:hypothetical protein
LLATSSCSAMAAQRQVASVMKREEPCKECGVGWASSAGSGTGSCVKRWQALRPETSELS